MATRISKQVLKWAWLEVERAVWEWEDADRQLTAAAIVALHENGRRINWRHPLPRGTTLEFSGRNVMLTWQPGTPGVQFPVSAESLGAARGLIESLPAPLQEALQCVALRALEGNFDWIDEPPFTASPDAQGRTP